MPTTPKDAILKSISDLLSKDESKRKSHIENSWDMYLCSHSKFFPRFEGETYADYVQRLKNDAYSINFVRRIVDEFTGYLYGRDVRRQLKDKSAQAVFELHWKRMHMQKYMQGIKTTGGVTGTAYTLARYMPSLFPKGDPIPLVYEPVDAAFVTLVWNPANPLEVREVIISYYFDESSGIAQVDTFRGHSKLPRHYVEYITDEEWLIWIDGRLQNGRDGQPDLMNWELYQGANPTGSLSAAFTVYRNYEVHGSAYGISDIKDAIPLNLKLDERKSDEGSVIGYHGLPLAVADFDIDNVIRGARRMVQIPPDGKFEYVTWDNDLSASLAHCHDLRQMLMVMSRLPEAAFFSEGMRQLRSAPALEIAFAPARSAVIMQQSTYGAAERERVKGDFLILRKLHNKSFASDEVEILYPDKFLPIDTFVETEMLRTRRELGLDSWQDQLLREHPKWTEKELKAHMDRCREDPLFGKGGVGALFGSPGEKSAEQDRRGRAGNAEGAENDRNEVN